MSYTEKICKAQDAQESAAAVQEGISHYGAILNMLVNSTPWDDLPILVATMQLTAGAMQPVIGEKGCAIVNELLEGVQTVAVKTDAVRKERGEG